MARTPSYNPDELYDAVESMSRGPFREVLARLLTCAPTERAMREQAEAHPDRWAQTVALIARLGGFNEHLEIDGSILHIASGMSDAQLMAEIRARQVRLGLEVSDEGAAPVIRALACGD